MPDYKFCFNKLGAGENLSKGESSCGHCFLPAENDAGAKKVAATAVVIMNALGVHRTFKINDIHLDKESFSPGICTPCEDPDAFQIVLDALYPKDKEAARGLSIMSSFAPLWDKEKALALPRQ